MRNLAAAVFLAPLSAVALAVPFVEDYAASADNDRIGVPADGIYWTIVAVHLGGFALALFLPERFRRWAAPLAFFWPLALFPLDWISQLF